MKHYGLTIVLVILFLLPTHLIADKYAGEIFRMGAGVRNFAIGNLGLTDQNSTALAYWNPALLHRVDDNRFELMHAEEYMGLLKYDTAAAIWGTDSKYSLVITRIGINDIPLTKLENPDDSLSFANRPYAYKHVNNADIVAYFGISRKVGNFNLGFTPKLAYRSLAEESGFGFGADISTYWEFSDDLMLAANIRDFFTTQILWANGTHEIVRPSIDLEAKYDFNIPSLHIPSSFYLGTNIFTESRDYSSTLALGFLSMDYHLGLEIDPHDLFDLYLGYDIEFFTTGASLNINNWQINYAFKHNTELDNSHRVSIGLRL